MPSKSLKFWATAQRELPPPQKATLTPAEPLGSLLTPRQASEYLQVPVSTLAVWRCTGRVTLRFLKVGTRQVRYRREDIDAFLSGRYPAGSTERPPTGARKPQTPPPRPESVLGSAAYWRSSHLAKWGRFVCESCSRNLQEAEAHVATFFDAPIADPHDTHCFCKACHQHLMRLPRPAPTPYASTNS